MTEPFFKMEEQELARISGGRYLGPTFVDVIQTGDSLPLLAQRFATTVRVLRELNDIQEPSDFKAGMRILIPQR